MVAWEVSLQDLEGLGLFGSRMGFEGGVRQETDGRDVEMCSGLADVTSLAFSCAYLLVQGHIAWIDELCDEPASWE